MPLLGRRIIENVMSEIAISAIFTIAMQLIRVTNMIFFLSMIICILVNIAYMVFCLRGYFFTIIGQQFYFKVNLTAYIILAVINIIMAYCNIEPFYTYMFFPYKLLMPIGFTKVSSALIVNGIFLLIILLIPPISKEEEL